MKRALVLLVLLTLAGPALAQQRAAPRAPEPAPAAPAPEIDPLYQPRLERLAEVLGSLHHLRPLCVPSEAQTWRAEMQALIEAEQPGQNRRDRLVAAFNRGILGLRDVHRTCTPAARLASDRYREEGSALVRDLVARFSN